MISTRGKAISNDENLKQAVLTNCSRAATFLHFFAYGWREAPITYLLKKYAPSMMGRQPGPIARARTSAIPPAPSQPIYLIQEVQDDANALIIDSEIMF